MKLNLRILLKALRKTFTSTTLVGFVQYLILSFFSSILITHIFGELLLWSGFLFLFLVIFINRLELVSKTVDEGKGDIPFISEEELDKEKTTALSRVFKRTFYSRKQFIVFLIIAIFGAVTGRDFELFFIVLAAIYLILFMICFLFDESGFLGNPRFFTSTREGPMGSEGGGGGCDGGGGGCGGDGGGD